MPSYNQKRKIFQKLKIRAKAKHPNGQVLFGCFACLLTILGLVFFTPVKVVAVECPSGSPININTANESDLDTLYGIGPAKAEDIVNYRDANGYFLKTIDIQKVSGIGSATYESIKLCITVGSESLEDSDNDTFDSERSESKDDEATNRTTANNNEEESYKSVISGPLDDNFSLSIRAPKVVYVNQTFSLDAEPKNVSDRYLKRLDYVWSFGDGEAGYKQFMLHMYKYPGTYAIVLKAKYRRSEQIARHTITVLPVDFSITRSPAGDIQINNDARYEINLTGYKVKGSKAITLPENTILLPGRTITIPKGDLVVGQQSLVRLYDEQGTIVASTFGATNQVQPTPVVTAPTPTVSGIKQDNHNFTFADDDNTLTVVEDQEEPGRATTTSSAESQDARTSIPTDSWPYLGLIGLLAIGTFGVLYKN